MLSFSWWASGCPCAGWCGDGVVRGGLGDTGMTSWRVGRGWFAAALRIPGGQKVVISPSVSGGGVGGVEVREEGES